MSIDQVTSQLTSGISKFVLSSFDRNIIRHQNRQFNEHKNFFCIFIRITEAWLYPLMSFVLKSGNSLNPVFKWKVGNLLLSSYDQVCAIRKLLWMSHTLGIIATPPPMGSMEYCDEHVCLSVFVSPWLYLRNYTSDPHQIFLCMLPVARSFSDGVVIRYVDCVMFAHKLIGCLTPQPGWGSECSLRLGA